MKIILKTLKKTLVDNPTIPEESTKNLKAHLNWWLLSLDLAIVVANIISLEGIMVIDTSFVCPIIRRCH